MRIVLDTNILARANPKASPQGLARELLLKTVADPNVLVVSAPILAEVRRVLSYPHVQARWPLTTEDIGDFLVLLAEISDFVESVPASFPVVITDPDDDPIVQTAVAGRADVLCTRDQAFHHSAVEQVCHSQHSGIVRYCADAGAPGRSADLRSSGRPQHAGSDDSRNSCWGGWWDEWVLSHQSPHPRFDKAEWVRFFRSPTPNR